MNEWLSEVIIVSFGLELENMPGSIENCLPCLYAHNTIVHCD